MGLYRSTLSLVLVPIILGRCSAVAWTAPPASSPRTVATTPVGSLAIRYEESAQFELTLPSGRHVYIDVGSGSSVEKQPAGDDVLLATIMFAHHYAAAFADGFPGQKLVVTHGELKLDDLHAGVVRHFDGAVDRGSGRELRFDPQAGPDHVLVTRDFRRRSPG